MAAATIATLGLAAVLFAFLSPLYWPLIVIWALCYYGFTFGSPASATIGMRVMDLEMRTWYGAPAYFVLGAVHAIVFWLTVSFLTPLILLVGFFNDRKRLLHDMLVGTVVINNPARAQMHPGRRAAPDAQSRLTGRSARAILGCRRTNPPAEGSLEQNP